MADVRPATEDDRGWVVSLLEEAFVDDPALRFFFPSDEDYVAGAPRLFGFLFEVRLTGGEVWVTDGAVAVWDPPGGNRLGTTVPGRWKAEVVTNLPAGSAERFERYEAALEPLWDRTRGWYLGLIATHPQRRGEGLARAVTRPVLERADREDRVATLETTNPGNLAVYRRLGFRELAHAKPADLPEVWVLERPPVGEV